MTHASSYSNGTQEITQLALDIFLSPEEPGYKLLGWNGLCIILHKYAKLFFFFFFSFHKAFKLLVKSLRQIEKQKGIFRNVFLHHWEW